MSGLTIVMRRASRLASVVSFATLLATAATAATPRASVTTPVTPVVIAKISVPTPGFAGLFLQSHFAQSEYNWAKADQYLDTLLKTDPHNSELLKRAMILSVGSGDLRAAAGRAQELMQDGQADGLSIIVLTLDDFAQGKAADVPAALAKMPSGEVADFVKPLLASWSDAAQGKFNVGGLAANPVHEYNGGLLALYLHRPADAEKSARQITTESDLTAFDAERAADLYAAAGDKALALKIYKELAIKNSEDRSLQKKIDAVENGGDLTKLIPALQIKTPAQGAAGAIFDLARLLFEQQSDATARVFASMALGANPDLTQARILIAAVLARDGKYDDAIRYFKDLKPDDPDYIELEYYVADLMQQGGHDDQALALLNKLYAQGHQIEALIRIGDIYREEKKYDQAIDAYNRGVKQLGGHVPASYWYLLYARGMCYEQTGRWPQGEVDLKEALSDRPDEPYLLNYLGYAWAERGLHYDEALKLVTKAEALKPEDGYIADSVGWVLYLMGHYKDAAAQLERAVALVPYDATLNDHLGDAYWHIGRKIDARFQWQRALGGSDITPAQRRDLDRKIASGLGASDVR